MPMLRDEKKKRENRLPLKDADHVRPHKSNASKRVKGVKGVDDFESVHTWAIQI